MVSSDINIDSRRKIIRMLTEEVVNKTLANATH